MEIQYQEALMANPGYI